MSTSIWELAERTDRPVETVVFQAVHLGAWDKSCHIDEDFARTLEQILMGHEPNVFTGLSRARRWRQLESAALRIAVASAALDRSEGVTADACALATGASPGACTEHLDLLVSEGLISPRPDGGYAVVPTRARHLADVAERIDPA